MVHPLFAATLSLIRGFQTIAKPYLPGTTVRLYHAHCGAVGLQHRIGRKAGDAQREVHVDLAFTIAVASIQVLEIDAPSAPELSLARLERHGNSAARLGF